MTAANEHVKDVTTERFQQDVVQRSRELPVVVDFWAEWCGPCRTLSPMLERVTAEHEGDFELAKVDVDQNQQLAAEFGVQGIPTVVAFRDGMPVNRFTGAIPEEALRSWISQILPSDLDLMVDEARTAHIEGDETTAEHIFRQVLDMQSDHAEAGASLASMLIERGEVDEALSVLDRLPSDSEVDRLRAAARLRSAQGDDIVELEAALDSDPADEKTRIQLALALAGRHEYEPALDHMLVVVRGKGELMNEARLAMIDIFDVLGDEHPLTATYRRQLASALF